MLIPHIHWEAGQWGRFLVHGKGARGSGPREREAFLFEEGRELLWWYIEEVRGLFRDDPEHPAAPLFPSERLPRTVADVNLPVAPAVVPATFRRTLKTASRLYLRGPVTELFPHLLRHACATHNYQQGMTLWEVQRLLGHGWATTTVRYLASMQADPEQACRDSARRAGQRLEWDKGEPEVKWNLRWVAARQDIWRPTDLLAALEAEPVAGAIGDQTGAEAKAVGDERGGRCVRCRAQTGRVGCGPRTEYRRGKRGVGRWVGVRWCVVCLTWDSPAFARGQVCARCLVWMQRYPARAVCRRCRREGNLDPDELCRGCLFAVKAEIQASYEAVFPAATQLHIHLPVPGRVEGGRLPRRSRGHADPALAPVPAAAGIDPRVCPPAITGQGTLFPARRRIERQDARRITAGRSRPEEDVLSEHIRALAAQGGLSVTWSRMVLRLIRVALALRDAEGERLVAPEMLGQVALPLKEVSAQILRQAGLLRDRVQPPLPRNPVRACAHCGSWGITTTLCLPCKNWNQRPGQYPVGVCPRCRREDLPLSARKGCCRSCLAHVRANGPGFHAPGTHSADLRRPARPPAQAPAQPTRSSSTRRFHSRPARGGAVRVPGRSCPAGAFRRRPGLDPRMWTSRREPARTHGTGTGSGRGLRRHLYPTPGQERAPRSAVGDRRGPAHRAVLARCPSTGP
ncbi:site-specific integrase [Streptomyces sp. NPDC020379]|uniref:site-specific integrase n=1 Tax=Streptomyces sp. NPDC020379 TaxID=3365071 RepID=UPI00379A6135